MIKLKTLVGDKIIKSSKGGSAWKSCMACAFCKVDDCGDIVAILTRSGISDCGNVEGGYYD